MIVRQKAFKKDNKSSLPAAPAVPRPPSTSPATQRPQVSASPSQPPDECVEDFIQSPSMMAQTPRRVTAVPTRLDFLDHEEVKSSLSLPLVELGGLELHLFPALLFCFVEAVYGTDRRVKASDVEDLITDALRFTPHTGGKERQVNHAMFIQI
ncbi:hypothetical protein AOXY_G27808 [Acipenser oxyrinchus oxyrinchus]|uniref:Uncharacterized protein n=1 Tax=Acipenser oxyrinchus oxyrinchus TaxID=40147 RepID=A0AAD8CPJ4_ACIOX|nr:hypothetical protein AOXY_G27808 [Acipenser oxyrinchus oxyrinchus]